MWRILRKQLGITPLPSRRPIARALCTTGSATPPPTDWTGVIALGSVVALTAGLGVWQTQRLQWKIGCIEQRERRLAQDPVSVTSALREHRQQVAAADGADVDCVQRVCVQGTAFPHLTMQVGPRPPPKDTDSTKLRGAQQRGALLVMPVVCDDGTLVLVNRGWQSFSVPLAADVGPSAGIPVRIQGVLRESEHGGGVTPGTGSSDQQSWAWFNASDMTNHAAAALGALLRRPLHPSELVVDAVEPATPADAAAHWPVQRPVSSYVGFHTMPETHVAYMVTWYSLAVLGTFMTWRRFRPSKASRARALAVRAMSQRKRP